MTINQLTNDVSQKDVKLKLYQILKDKQANHIYFYEKHLNFNSLQLLRDKISVYVSTMKGHTLQDSLSVNSTVNPIVLHVHCPGGDIDAGIAAMKLIHQCCIPVITMVDGLAASAATYMCMASSLRIINPHGHMLIHQLSQLKALKGKYISIEDRYLRIKKYMETLKKIYNKYTKLTSEQIKEILQKDLYLDSTTCLKYGLVDKIMD